MKIVHVIPTLGSGGAERFAVDLVNELSKEHEVYLVVLFGLDKPANSFFLPQVSSLVNVLTFEKRRGPDFSIFMKMKRLISKLQPDVINTHLSAVNYVLPFMQRSGISFVHTIHSEPRHEAKTKIEFWTRKFAYQKGWITPVTISNDSQQSFRDYYSLTSDVLIFNGREQIEATDDLPKVVSIVDSLRSNADARVLVSIGRFVPLKRQLLLAKIVHELIEEGHSLGLIFLGADSSTYANEVNLEIAKLNCEQIASLGKVSNISDYLIASDGFCISSELEGMPMSYIEALSVKCLPISTPVGGLATLITEDLGFLALDLSHEGLKQAIKRYIQTPDSVLNTMKANAYKQFQDLFIISKTVSQYLSVYEKR